MVFMGVMVSGVWIAKARTEDVCKSTCDVRLGILLGSVSCDGLECRTSYYEQTAAHRPQLGMP